MTDAEARQGGARERTSRRGGAERADSDPAGDPGGTGAGPLPPSEVLSSGVPGLDEIIGGGFARNRLHLLEGAPGTGKTTLALQFLLDGIRRGEPGLLISFAETRSELAAVAASHGWSLDGLDILEALPPREELLPSENYTLFHPMEVELGETMQEVLEEVERVQPSRVAFDPISHLRLMARDPLIHRRQVLVLRRFFIDRSSTVLLVDNAPAAPGPGYQLRTAAHSVVTLEQTPQEYGADRRRLRVLKVRGVNFREGFHDVSLGNGGMVVFPRLVVAEGEGAPEGLVSSGIAELDALAGGGLAPGTSVLIMGPAGVGKSTTAAAYLWAAAERGEPAAVFTFEETRHTYLARTEALGLPLRRHYESGRVRIQRVEPAEWSAGEFSARVRRAVDGHGCGVVVIDSLNGYLRSLPREANLPLHLRELLNYLSRERTLVILTLSQHGVLEEGSRVAVELSYLTDAVILLRYFEAGGRIRQAISVTKNRAAENERTIREFKLSKRGIQVGEPLSEFRGILRGVPTYTGGSERLMGLVKQPGSDAGADDG